MQLRDHIEGVGPIADLAAYLANLDPSQRWEQLAGLDKRHQRTLYLKAEGSRPVVASDLVGAEGLEVVHRGKNSLRFFRDFEKRMVATDSGIWGFNEGATRRWLGPGYFRCRPCETPDERRRSSWVVDYFDVPDAAPLEAWPTVRDNGRLLSWFVYHHTRDYLRVVADGVLIGSAHKTLFGRERKLDSYFLLVREPGPDPAASTGT